MTNQDRDPKGDPAGPKGTAPHVVKAGEKDDASDMNNYSVAPDDAPAAVLDERIQAQIGQQLSNFYRELVNQPIPQNFIDLLAKLDRQEDGK